MADEYVGYRTVGLVFVGLCVALGTAFALSGASDQETVHPPADEEVESYTAPIENQSETPFYPQSGRSENVEDIPWDDLSYQEQLQRSGDVDGRQKDYFTPDGDEEFGGAVVGMEYADFRDRLLFAGFTPIPVNRDQCDLDHESEGCAFAYPETDVCGGISITHCTHWWRKDRQRFYVRTVDHEKGKVVSMSYDR